MSRYVVLIDGKKGAYGVTVPDLPGCTAMGRSVEEALAKLDPDAEIESFLAKIRDIQDRAALVTPRFKSMAEFDAHEYDERGNPR